MFELSSSHILKFHSFLSFHSFGLGFLLFLLFFRIVLVYLSSILPTLFINVPIVYDVLLYPIIYFYDILGVWFILILILIVTHTDTCRLYPPHLLRKDSLITNFPLDLFFIHYTWMFFFDQPPSSIEKTVTRLQDSHILYKFFYSFSVILLISFSLCSTPTYPPVPDQGPQILKSAIDFPLYFGNFLKVVLSHPDLDLKIS